MKLNIQLSDEIKQELDTVVNKFENEIQETRKDFKETTEALVTEAKAEIQEAKKGIKKLVLVNVLTKVVMTVAICGTVLFVTQQSVD